MSATDTVVEKMCGTGKSLSNRDFNEGKERFVFQSWSSWAEENSLTKNGEVFIDK